MGIEHVVVLMYENRSFDHMLGLLDHPDPAFPRIRAQTDEFSIFLSLNILIGAAVAGLGSLWGIAAGAAFVALLPNISSSAPVIGSIHGQDVAFGVVVIAVMLLIPTGFAGLLQRIAARVVARNRRAGGISAPEAR